MIWGSEVNTPPFNELKNKINTETTTVFVGSFMSAVPFENTTYFGYNNVHIFRERRSDVGKSFVSQIAHSLEARLATALESHLSG